MNANLYIIIHIQVEVVTTLIRQDPQEVQEPLVNLARLALLVDTTLDNPEAPELQVICCN